MTTLEELIELMSPDVSREAVQAVGDALITGEDTVDINIAVPRSCAKLIFDVLTLERKQGALVIPAKHEFSPSDAATVLGVSRQTVVRLIEAGKIPARKAGTHWRIAASDLSQAVVAKEQDHFEDFVQRALATEH